MKRVRQRSGGWVVVLLEKTHARFLAPLVKTQGFGMTSSRKMAN